MGRRISIESRLFRGLLAVTAVGSLLGCARAGSRPAEGTPTPIPPELLSCGQAEFYPEGDRVPPETANYYLEIPQNQGCGIVLYQDGYRDFFLLIYADKIEFIIFENAIGDYSVDPMPLPTEGDPVEFSWGEVSGEVMLVNGYYIVTYTAPSSQQQVPSETPPGPALPDGWINTGN